MTRLRDREVDQTNELGCPAFPPPAAESGRSTSAMEFLRMQRASGLPRALGLSPAVASPHRGDQRDPAIPTVSARR